MVGSDYAFCDGNYYIGDYGHDMYVDAAQEQVNEWRTWSNGCDVDSDF